MDRGDPRNGGGSLGNKAIDVPEAELKCEQRGTWQPRKLGAMTPYVRPKTRTIGSAHHEEDEGLEAGKHSVCDAQRVAVDFRR